MILFKGLMRALKIGKQQVAADEKSNGVLNGLLRAPMSIVYLLPEFKLD